ncbi:MAG: hypothetical protein RIB60_10930 [Phycisphaerales bacterium]
MRMLAIAVLVLSVFAGSARAQSDGALVARFDRAYADGAYERAATVATTLAERHESSSVWAFNAACAHARAGNLDDARRWVTACAERGFQGVRSFETDQDLDPIRGSQEFAEAFALVQAAARARLEEFQQAARVHAHPSWVPEHASTDSPVPLVIALHGTGGRGDEMLRVWKEACAEVGAAIIAPDGLRPSGEGYAWTYRDESEWLVRDLIERVAAGMPVDTTRVVLTGFSQGANVAMPTGIDHAGLFVGVIPVGGHYEGQIVDLEPVRSGAIVPPRYGFIIGSRDRWAGTFRAAEREFEEAGVEVKLEVVPGMGHEMPRGRGGTARLARMLAWCLGEGDEGPGDEPGDG